MACANGHAEIVKILLDAGAVRLAAACPSSPLH